MASISDVAKRAEVAKSTVSLVINNNGYVSEGKTL
ncbi:MAG: LacI family DNA-binding transcriptional regulator [Lachnospiraceae bacterium]|nr:LacI family DNA-binding transcriptional regulator [Lachnospiraceae bacterium]